MTQAAELAALGTVVNVDASGNVGIGTATPAGDLEVASTTGQSTIYVTGRSPTTGTAISGLWGRGSNVGNAVQFGQWAFYTGASGWDGTAYRDMGYIAFVTAATPANSTVPSHIDFYTTPAGTSQSPALRMRLDSNGDLAMQGGAITSGKIIQGTSVASTSGTAINFTGIPSWAKRITVEYQSVSTSGTSSFQIQIGTSSSVETTGYAGGCIAASSGAAGFTAFTSGFVLQHNGETAAASRHGALIISNLTGNTWTATGGMADSGLTRGCSANYSKTLAGTLDRVRITTVNGTDTFDAGTVNITWE